MKKYPADSAAAYILVRDKKNLYRNLKFIFIIIFFRLYLKAEINNIIETFCKSYSNVPYVLN